MDQVLHTLGIQLSMRTFDEYKTKWAHLPRCQVPGLVTAPCTNVVKVRLGKRHLSFP